MNEIDLNNNKLTELTEDNLITLCHLNGFKPNELESLDLSFNFLTNIDFITENTPFINLKIFIFGYNKNLKNISNIKYLTKLKYLGISGLNLNNELEVFNILKSMKKLKELNSFFTFKNYTYKQLKKAFPNIKIYSE